MKRNQSVSPILMIIQIVLGGAAGIFVAVMTLDYFWEIDVIGRGKKQPVVARAAKPASPPRIVAERPVAAPAQPKAEQPAPQARIRPEPPPLPPPQPAPLLAPEPEPAAPEPAVEAAPQPIEAPAEPEPVPPEPLLAEPEPEPVPEPAADESGDSLVLYNTHNWNYGERGTKTCNVYLRRFDSLEPIWAKTGVEIAWEGRSKGNPSTTVRLPDIKYDIVRIEVVTWEGVGGGLAEVAVLNKGSNIALRKPAMASAPYRANSDVCSAQMVTDGIADESSPEAGDGKGYWLLPSGTPGWIEILVHQPRVPPKGRSSRSKRGR